MPLLSEPHCPQCLSTLSLSPLWRAFPKGRRGYFWPGKVGIVCPHCGAKLRVITTRIDIASWVALCAFFGAFYYAVSLMDQPHLEPSQKAALVCVLGFAGLAQLVPYLFGPNLARLRPVDADETVKFPLEEAKAEDNVTTGSHATSNHRWRGP